MHSVDPRVTLTLNLFVYILYFTPTHGTGAEIDLHDLEQICRSIDVDFDATLDYNEFVVGTVMHSQISRVSL